MRELLDHWTGLKEGFHPTTDELATLIAAADMATDAHPADWAVLRDVLETHTDMTKKEVAAQVRRSRIIADLGSYPYDVAEFIVAFMTSRRVRMNYSEVFTRAGQPVDLNYIENEMSMWSHRMSGTPAPIYSKQLIADAFANWITTEKAAILRRGYGAVAFQPTASKSALHDFAAYITAPAETPEQTERHVRATEVAFANFIYRVKNHMRGVHQHGCHLMPVLFGPQGSGKTTAVEAFLGPISDFYSSPSFDLFGDNSREFDLSIMPVMFFDELAGVGKADVERIKAAMTQKSRSLRQIYRKASVRTLMATFIGCTNKDISTLIRDETGNRRFLQIASPKLSREKLRTFDFKAMWQSVDEDAAEPPFYALPDDFAAVAETQAEQAYVGPVQAWIEDDDTAVIRSETVPDLFRSYSAWLEVMSPAQARFADVRTFRAELKRLHEGDLAKIIRKTNPKNVPHYRFEKSVPLPVQKIVDLNAAKIARKDK